MKDNLMKFIKTVTILSVVIAMIGIILFTYLHVAMLPIKIVFYPQEIILLFSMIVLYLLTKRYNMKCFKIISIIGIILGIINLIGLNLILKGW